VIAPYRLMSFGRKHKSGGEKKKKKEVKGTNKER
jgi:hypothetical protein